MTPEQVLGIAAEQQSRFLDVTVSSIVKRGRLENERGMQQIISLLRERGHIVHNRAVVSNETHYRLTRAGWLASGVQQPMGVE